MSSVITLTQQLQQLAQELAQAEHEGDVEAAESAQEKIWEIEDQLEELSDFQERQHYS